MKKLKIFILVSTITFSLVLIAKAGSSAGRAIFEGNVGIGTMNPVGKLHVEGPGHVIFNTSGNVGIGTRSPTQKLDVIGFVRGSQGLCIGNDCRTSWPGGGSGSSYWAANGANIYNTNRGNVGIGTTNPVTKLDVRGHINIQDGNNAAVIYFPRTGRVPNLYIRSDDDPTTYERSSERVVIGSNGNVGIGTTAPSAKLHVVNTDPASSWVTTLFSGYHPNISHFVFQNQGRGSAAVQVRGAEEPGVKYLNLVMEPNANNRAGITGNVGTFYIYAGNVGIGTTAPTEKLEVAGKIKASDGICIGNDCRTSWPGGGSGYWAANGSNIYNTNRGYVGIGTKAPTANLDVRGWLTVGGHWASEGFITFEDHTPYGNNFHRISFNNLRFYDGGYGDMVVFNNGNVGIRTTNPVAPLDVRGVTSGNVRHSLYVYSSSTRDSVISIVGGQGNDYLHLLGRNTERDKGGFYIFTGDNLNEPLYFGRDNYGTPAFPDVVDMALVNGNVGIGTMNPVGKLHVEGPGHVIFNTSGNVGIGTRSPTQKLDVIGFVRGSQGLCIGNDCRTSWPGGGSGYWAANGSNIYNTNSGYVGIGTTMPTKKLEVNGTMGFTGGRGPFCIFSNRCPNGWVDKGLGGYIYNSAGGASCPYSQGAPLNNSWTWCHPRICCNE